MAARLIPEDLRIHSRHVSILLNHSKKLIKDLQPLCWQSTFPTRCGCSSKQINYLVCKYIKERKTWERLCLGSLDVHDGRDCLGSHWGILKGIPLILKHFKWCLAWVGQRGQPGSPLDYWMVTSRTRPRPQVACQVLPPLPNKRIEGGVGTCRWAEIPAPPAICRLRELLQLTS